MERAAKVQPIPVIEAARWLVEFEARNTSPLMRYTHHPDWPAMRAKASAFILNDYTVWRGERQVERLLPRGDILELQELVQKGFRELFNSAEGFAAWYVQVEGRQFGLLRHPSGVISPLTGEVSRSAFMIRVLAVLQAIGPRLRRCADARCQRFFISNRRQVYCTRTCSDRVRLAKWRRDHAKDEQRKAKVRKQQRAAYARRMRRKLGARVKVGGRR